MMRRHAGDEVKRLKRLAQDELKEVERIAALAGRSVDGRTPTPVRSALVHHAKLCATYHDFLGKLVAPASVSIFYSLPLTMCANPAHNLTLSPSHLFVDPGAGVEAEARVRARRCLAAALRRLRPALLPLRRGSRARSRRRRRANRAGHDVRHRRRRRPRGVRPRLRRRRPPSPRVAVCGRRCAHVRAVVCSSALPLVFPSFARCCVGSSSSPASFFPSPGLDRPRSFSRAHALSLARALAQPPPLSLSLSVCVCVCPPAQVRDRREHRLGARAPPAAAERRHRCAPRRRVLASALDACHVVCRRSSRALPGE